MRTFDLVDQAEYLEKEERRNQTMSSARKILNSADEQVRLAVLRDLMIDQFSILIDKFPQQTQQELVALLTDKYMNKWAN